MHYFEIYYICVDRETGLPDSVSVKAADYNHVVCKFNALGLHLDPGQDDLMLFEFETDSEGGAHCVSIRHGHDYPDGKIPCVIYDSEEVA